MTDQRIQKASNLYRNRCYGEALELYVELANEGNISCQRFVGWMHFFGRGTPRDIEKAQGWFEKSAQQGDLEGKFGLGRVYVTRKEYERARECFQVTAERDFLPGIYRLGWIHLNGYGVKVNESLALELYSKAAAQGHIMARRGYAGLLVRGREGFFGRFKGVYLLNSAICEGFVRALKNAHDPVLLC